MANVVRLEELKELERLGLKRPETFPNPISYYGGQAFIASLDAEAENARKRYLEHHGQEAIKAKFPQTWREYWPGI